MTRPAHRPPGFPAAPGTDVGAFDLWAASGQQTESPSPDARRGGPSSRLLTSHRILTGRRGRGARWGVLYHPIRGGFTLMTSSLPEGPAS